MTFWIICCLLTVAVTAMIVVPMFRPPQIEAEDPQIALYKAQLAEVDRDVARDVVAPEDAERAKAEIARRLIATANQSHAVSESPITRPVAAVTALAVVGLAGVTYWSLGAPGYADLPLKTRIALGDEARENRPSQQEAEAAAPQLDPPDVPEDYLVSVEQLRTLVPLRPDDLRGWELLAFHESQLRDYAAAAAAQARVIAIKADAATVDDLVRHADLLVAAADGFISPETEVVVREILRVNPQSIPGRYYLGALFDQTDRPDRALQLWRSILEAGAGETFHLAMARRQVEMTAARAGITYTPPDPQELAMEDVLASQDLDDDARAEMISGMIASLADRLATQGGPVTQWARLIVAYGVVGRTDDAKDILAEARGVFGASQEALAVLDEAAMRAGLSQ